MEDAFARLRPATEPETAETPVTRWRRAWQQVEARTIEGGDTPLAARRRDYGSLLFIALDVGLTLACQIALSIPLIILVLGIFLATGHNLLGRTGQSQLNTWLVAPAVTLLGGVAISDGSMLLVLWYRLTRQRLRWSLYGLGTQLRAGAGRAVLTGLGIGAVALILSSLLTNAIAHMGFNVNGQDTEIIQPLQHAPSWIVVSGVFAATFIAPVVEETFFRGYIFRALATRKSVPLAYLVSAGTFALIHLSSGFSLLPIIPVLFVIGLLLCYAYHRTGNLLSDITAHIVNNGAAFALALLPLPHHL